MIKKKSRKKMSTARKAEMGFYISIVTLPFIMFILMSVIPGYFYIFIFVIQKYDPYTGNLYFQPDIFYNIREFLHTLLQQPDWAIGALNSFKLWLISWTLMPVSLFTSFYVAKKMPASRFFRFILMMPGMLSGMIWVLLYKNFADFALVDLFNLPYGALSDIDQQFTAVVIYGIWMSIPSSLLVYSGVLSGVSSELIDAGRVDGLNLVGEFWHISLPHLYPVWMVSLIGMLTGFLTASGSVFEFYGLNANRNNYTIGFLMFQKVMSNNGVAYYGFNAAGSIVFSFVGLPITLIGKWALERYGPSEDSREPIRWFWRRKKV